MLLGGGRTGAARRSDSQGRVGGVTVPRVEIIITPFAEWQMNQ